MWEVSVRRLRIGPLLGAMAICVLFALFGNALIGESLGNWYGALDKPWFLVPLWAFYIAGFVYYVLFATVLYRILTRVEDRRVRVTALALALCVLFLNKLWNYGFFGLESTLLGFAGILVFLIPLRRLSSLSADKRGSRRGWSPRTTCGRSTTSPGRISCGG
jgi:translocator protein